MINVNLMSGMRLGNTFNDFGGTIKSQADKKLKEDIYLLLKQEKYKFFPDPEFGSELNKYLFEPLTEATGEMIKLEVHDLISKYYPDLELNYINVDLVEKGFTIIISYNYTDSGEATELQVSYLNKERSE